MLTCTWADFKHDKYVNNYEKMTAPTKPPLYRDPGQPETRDYPSATSSRPLSIN